MEEVVDNTAVVKISLVHRDALTCNFYTCLVNAFAFPLKFSRTHDGNHHLLSPSESEAMPFI